MPERLLSAAACAEIAARAAVADERHELVVWISLTELQGLLATVAALREALEPFAEIGTGYKQTPDDKYDEFWMQVRPFRRAAAVYEATGP